jgi:8-amino-7-oxononanoate synthase
MGIKQRAAAIQSAYGALQALGRDPTSLKFDRITSPTRAVLGNEPVMLFGTNNYLGLTFDQ